MSLEITDPKFWRLLHSHFIDALECQYPDNVYAILVQAEGCSFAAFVGALQSGFIRARPAPGDDDSACVGLEVRGDDDWHRMTRVQAELLGLDPAIVQREIDAELDSAIRAILREST